MLHLMWQDFIFISAFLNVEMFNTDSLSTSWDFLLLEAVLLALAKVYYTGLISVDDSFV